MDGMSRVPASYASHGFPEILEQPAGAFVYEMLRAHLVVGR